MTNKIFIFTLTVFLIWTAFFVGSCLWIYSDTKLTQSIKSEIISIYVLTTLVVVGLSAMYKNLDNL